MRPQRKLHFTGDISSAFRIFPLDYFCQRYCIFQEDAIMMQQSAHKLKPVVAMATFCVILTALCNLPQVLTLGSDCYTITGIDYRGTQDKIELPPYPSGAAGLIQSTACLPWNSSIESQKPRARERGIGRHNYCRNPDEDILPWCKVPGVAGSDGAWGYCHLPTCKVPGYLGCFLDKGQPPALDSVSILHKSMTVGACLEFCRKQGFKFAGLEAGHACYCGNHGHDRYGSSAERGTHCASKCFGNKKQPCGGDGYVDVYKADIGACGTTAPMRDQSGAVYSPGYPDFPSSAGLVTSLNAADVMMQKSKEKMDGNVNEEDDVARQSDNNAATVTDETCSWRVDIKQATEVNMLIRKIDSKRKLGGVIEIDAADDAVIVIKIPEKSVTSSNGSSNATEPPAVRTVKSRIVWIGDSTKARGEVDVIVPDDVITHDGDKRTHGEDSNEMAISGSKPRWTDAILKRRSGRYVLPSNTLQPMVSVTGGRFTIRFLRSPEMIASLKSSLDLQRQRSRSRKKASSSEYSRFIVEYEADIPEDAILSDDDVMTDVTGERNNGASSSSTGVRRKNQKHHQRNKNQNEDASSETADDRSRQRSSFTAKVSQDELGKTRFTISQADAKAIKDAMSSVDSTSNGGGNSPIKIEVFVEPVPRDEATEDRSADNKQPMSEFTIPLLLAVLLTTTAILILSAVLVVYRRGGIASKKHEKKDHGVPGGLVVACHPRGGGPGMKRSSSDSNLSSSSTADSLLLTDSDTSKYSPRLRHEHSPPVSPTTLKNLMEILKGHPGILNRPPLEAEQYKQITPHPSYLAFDPESRSDARPDDVAPLPGPCLYCCGCADDNRTHRHGDSCRSHHNQGKYGKTGGIQVGSASRPSGTRNTRGLTIRGCLKANATSQQQGMSVAPPLSPIREVSSVTSSMMSLPITSSNSQTSLLSRHAPSSPQRKFNKKEDLLGLGPEAEAFLAAESDGESGVGDLASPSPESTLPLVNRATKLRFSDNITEKIVPARYLGGAAGACYDSGYATSNYEEEEEYKTKRELAKANPADGVVDMNSKLETLINP